MKGKKGKSHEKFFFAGSGQDNGGSALKETMKIITEGEGVSKIEQPKIIPDLVAQDKYRVVKISAIGKKHLGLHSQKDWYAAQVNINGEWWYISEPDSKTKKPVITYFETEKMCNEYIQHKHNEQLENLRKLGWKPKPKE